MRRVSVGLRCLGAGLLAVAGCHGPETLKPPLHEEYVLPPNDDPRFSTPPAYPKETLDSGSPKKDENKKQDGFGGPSGTGGSVPGRMGVAPGGY
jgi:hypothetical protein